MSDNVISSIGTNQKLVLINRVQLRKTLTLMQVVMMGVGIFTTYDDF